MLEVFYFYLYASVTSPTLTIKLYHSRSFVKCHKNLCVLKWVPKMDIILRNRKYFKILPYNQTDHSEVLCLQLFVIVCPMQCMALDRSLECMSVYNT